MPNNNPVWAPLPVIEHFVFHNTPVNVLTERQDASSISYIEVEGASPLYNNQPGPWIVHRHRDSHLCAENIIEEGAHVIIRDQGMAIVSLNYDCPVIHGQVDRFIFAEPGFAFAIMSVVKSTHTVDPRVVPLNLDHVYASHIVVAFPLRMINLPQSTLSFVTCTHIIRSIAFTDISPHRYGPPARIWEEDPDWVYPNRDRVTDQYEIDNKWWLQKGEGRGCYKDYMWQTEALLSCL